MRFGTGLFCLGHVDGAGQEVHWVRGSGPGRKRIRLNRKTPAHLAGFRVQFRPRVWKRLRLVGYSRVSIPDHKRRRGDQDDGGYNPAQVRTGVGSFPGFCASPRHQVCTFPISL